MKIQLRKTINKQIESITEFEIREVREGEKELEDNLKYCLSKFTEGILDPDVAGKSPDKFISNLQNSFLGDFSKRYILNAYDTDKIIGILIAIPKDEETLHLYSLHVSQKYRSKGVGSDLLAKCINDAYRNKKSNIILDVHLDNKPAYNLYKKFDFQEL